MFRAPKRLNPSSFSLSKFPISHRAPFSKSARRFDHESLNPYKVRFKAPGLTPRRLATFALYSGCITGYLWYFGPEVEVEVEVQEGGQQGQKSGEFVDGAAFEDSEYAEEDSFFIPLTWAWKLPRSYYKGSDPEWQEFVKIAKDQTKHKRINRMSAPITIISHKQTDHVHS